MSLDVYLLGPGKVPGIGPEKGRKPSGDGVAKYVSPHGSYRYVAYVGGEPVSALQVVSQDSKNATIANVYTAPEARQQGWASKLLQQARRDFKSVEHAKDEHVSDEGKAWREKVHAAAKAPPGWTEERGSSGRSSWVSPDGKAKIQDAGAATNQRFQCLFQRGGKWHEDIGWPSLTKALQYVEGKIGLRDHPMHKTTAEQVVARFKQKKKVESEDGGETTVYVYSERQIARRNAEKAKRIEALRGRIGDLRKQVQKDIKSSDPQKFLTALAVALMDETFERVGGAKATEGDNEEGKPHYGVTTWRKEHVSFGRGGGATIKYTGKSGVKQKKVVKTKAVVQALRNAYEACPNDDIFEHDTGHVTATKVNDYLKTYDVTAKDLRGYHANDRMKAALSDIREGGGDLPDDKSEREAVLKKEWKDALNATAEELGHESSTLEGQYLVPGLMSTFMKDGTIMPKMVTASIVARFLARG
jgi:GNAT superfamily N-acetyltransferase